MPHLTRVGLVGCGAIGTYIAKLLKSKFKKQTELIYLNDINPHHAGILAGTFRRKPKVVDLNTLIIKSDLIIEAAHASVVRPLVTRALKLNKSILIMSVGGLLGIRDLNKLVRSSRGKIYLPSGAIAGIDALSAAMQDGINKVELITRKPVKGLIGAPILKRKRINLTRIKKETLLFSGTARQAVKAFPQNVNVAAMLSLATLGPEHVKVKVFADPEAKRNSHEIKASGSFGNIKTFVENEPSIENPKTSALAQYSVGATLKKIFSNLKIGT